MDGRRAAEPEARLVLIVAPSHTERSHAREALQAAGFLVEAVDDGAEVLRAIERRDPAVVIVDATMASVDGFAACQRLRSLPGGGDLTVLIATDPADLDSAQRAYAAGATDVVAKPINWPLLAQRVRHLQRAAAAVHDLKESHTRLTDAQEIAQIGNWLWDVDTDQVTASTEAFRIFGLRPVIGAVDHQLFLDRIAAEDRDRVQTAFAEAVRADRGVDLDFRIQPAEGPSRLIATRAEPTIGDQHRGPVLRGTYQDITERRRAEARIHHLTHHDPLTELPNQVLFRDRLAQALGRARREHGAIAVHLVDLDHFQAINDRFGHAIGDRLIRETAFRLQNEVRGCDTVARLGGDQFAIIQASLKAPEGAETLAGRLLTALARDCQVGDDRVGIGASVGVALHPNHADEVDQLLTSAEVALSRAKADGRARFCVFSAGMEIHPRGPRNLERDLRRGLAEGWLELHYLPQLAADTGAVVGVEALLRLRHPERGLIMPSELIPVADETGLIVPIGAWVLRTACTQMATWRREGVSLARIAVNLSPVQFYHADLVATVNRALLDADLEPAALEVEITERMLLEDTARALEILGRLRSLGVHIAMDDFGTGYSSLSCLKLFSFDRIKIDRSFVGELADNPDAAALARAIVSLSRSLRMSTTAEGVETAAQLAYLKGEACDEVQGFFFGQPLPAAEITTQLRAGGPPVVQRSA